MKNFLLSTVLMTLLFLVTTNNAFTQPKQLGQAGANIGYNLPMGTFGDFYKGGFNLGANLEYRLLSKLGVSVSFNYASWKWDDLGSGWSHDLAAFSTIGFLLGGKYYITDINGTIPYAGINLGYYSFTKKKNFNDPTETFSNLGLNVCGGALIPIDEKLSVNAFVDYTNIFTKSYSTNYLGIHAGIVFKFNMSEDEEE
ncbi:MAG: outer membrane beta-barrel protein [Bacteroidota bacterium]|jgi:outer membrane protein W